jgi:hypothetical protein
MAHSSGSFAVSFTAAVIIATPALLTSFLLQDYFSESNQSFFKAFLVLFSPIFLLNSLCFMALSSFLPAYGIVHLLEANNREPSWILYGFAGMVTGPMILLSLNTLFHIGSLRELFKGFLQSADIIAVFGLSGFVGGAVFGIVRIRMKALKNTSISTDEM